MFIQCICYLLLCNKLHQSLGLKTSHIHISITWFLCIRNPGVVYLCALVQGLSSSNEGVDWGCQHIKVWIGKDLLPGSFTWLLAMLRSMLKSCDYWQALGPQRLLPEDISSLPCGACPWGSSWYENLLSPKARPPRETERERAPRWEP